MTYTIVKRGDALIPITGSVPLDLTSGSAYVTLYNRTNKTSNKYTASIVDAPNGIIQYKLPANALAYDRRYFLEWEGHAVNGAVRTDPSVDFHTLVIKPDLR